MILAKVLGTVVPARKTEGLRGVKLLLLGEVDPERRLTGTTRVAADAVGAGIGEFVLCATGSAAQQTEQTHHRPCDAVVTAILESWEIGGLQLYKRGARDEPPGDESAPD